MSTLYKRICLLLLVVSSISIKAELETSYLLLKPSLSGIAVGMKLPAIKKQFPDVFSDNHETDNPECMYLYRSANDRSAGFMIIDNRVVRIDVLFGHENVKLLGGLGVGSTEEAVKATYPNLVSSVHEYLGSEGSYLTIKLGENMGLIFETYKGKVTNYRVGEFPYVGFIEGCS